MSRFAFKKRAPGQEELPKGAWEPVRLPNATARVRCPSCGYVGLLDHDIAADGTVSPSVQCPADGCTFHEMAVLLDWRLPNAE